MFSNSTPKYKPPIAVDFDGVLFKDNETCVGACEFLRELHKKYYVVIFSARVTTNTGATFIHNWITKNKLGAVVQQITDKKHLNFAKIIDDKAIFCDGTNYKEILESLEI